MAQRPLVCALVYDELCLFELGIAAEVFGLPRPEFDDWYDFRIIAAQPGPLHTLGGMTIEAAHDLSLLSGAALVIVPGWPQGEAGISDALRYAIIAAHQDGTRFASICSGAFLLAACGLLDGRRATTHWRYADRLQADFPAIHVDPNVLYVDEGDVMTSAGSAAGLDLCLHIVRQDYGSDIANQVARRLVLPAHRQGGQAQFIPRPLPRHRAGDIAPLLDQIRQTLDENWTIPRMAKGAGLSPRTLQRRFMDGLGESPQNWLVRERIEHAKELLETTELHTDDIALACGFGTPETLRHHFRRTLGTSPLQYRAQFAS